MRSGLRPKIREFIECVDWIAPTNITYLAKGKHSHALYKYHEKILRKMLLTKRPDLALKVFRNQDGKIAYTLKLSSRSSLGNQHYYHDKFLRNCLAKLVHDRGFKKLSISNPKNADAYYDGFYIEFDNGHMNDDQLRDKIEKHYSENGAYRVIFFMAHRDIARFERARLIKLFKIAKEVLPKKPNRILGACYSEFLEDGKIYNRKLEEVKL